jgi:hypothetical protein
MKELVLGAKEIGSVLLLLQNYLYPTLLLFPRLRLLKFKS